MVTNQPVTNSFAERGGRCGSTGHSQRGQTIVPTQRAPCHQPGNQVERRPQRWTSKPRRAPFTVDHVHRESILHLDVTGGTNAIEEPERVAVAAEKDMLPVVHTFAGGGIGECRCTPAKRRPRFEDEHARALFGEQRRRREPGEASADDDGVRSSRFARSGQVGYRVNSARSHRRIAIKARYGRGTRILRLNTS